MNQPAPLMNSSRHAPTSARRPQAQPLAISRLKRAWLLAAALGVAGLSSAPAQTTFWTGGGSDLNWSTALNWTNAIPPLPGDTVFFSQYGAAGGQGPAGAANNIVDSSIAIQSLRYTNNPAVGGNHNTLLNPGVTLTITNSLFVGTLFDAAGVPSVYTTITGAGGTLVVTNPSGTISVRQGEVTASASATLDLRGLDNLYADVSQVLPAGENIGKNVATMYFANTNVITCYASGTTAGLIVGNNNTSGSKTVRSFLGVTNVILSDGGIEVPQKRMTSTLSFNSTGSGLYCRNRAGTGRQDHWNIGFNNTSGTGTGCSGTFNLTGGTVDAMVNTLVVGAGETSGSSGGGGTGSLLVSGGIIDVNTVDIGEQFISASAATGTLSVTGANAPAQITVNNNLRLARNAGGASSGTLSIGNSAAVTVKGSIIGGTGTGTSTITVQSAALTMGSSMGAAGTGQGPITTFQLSASDFTVDLSGSANPVTPVCTVGTFDGVQPCTLNLLGSALSEGQFQLIKYSSIIDDGFNAFTTVVLPAQVQGYLSNNVANSSIDVVITNVIVPTWNGLPTGDWDINLTANWKLPDGSATTYHQSAIPGDQVIFNDTALGTTTVNLTTILSPVSISVNNSSKAYTYNGTGALSGPGSLAKNGDNTLTIANSGVNNFAGAVTIGGGTLKLGVANALPTNAAVTLADATGALLDLNNQSQSLGALSGGGLNGGNVSLGSATLSFIGTGGNYGGVISGSGMIVMTNSGSQVLAGANLYSGGTLISTGTLALANSSGSGTGPGGVDIEGGTLNIGNGTGGGSVTGTITNNGFIAFNRSDDITFDNPITGSGAVYKYLSDTVTIDIPNTYTGFTDVAEGALRMADPQACSTTLITVLDGGTSRLELQGGLTVTNAILLNSKGGSLNGNNPVLVNVSGTNILSGPIQATSSGTDLPIRSDADELILTGSFIYESASSHQIVRLRGNSNGEWHGSIANTTNGQIVALYKQDAGTWVLANSSTNTYTDVTQISGGTLVVNGSILGTGAVSVQNAGFGATLGGTGLLAGAVSLAGGTLAPGATTDSGVIGTLTISNDLAFDGSSTASFDLSTVGGVAANDRVVGLNTVTFDGLLSLTLTGTPSGGEVFKLFSANSYQGAFNSIALPPNPLPPPLVWDTDFLAVDGTVRVDGISLTNAMRTSDGNFQFSGSVPSAGAGLSYRVLASTNVALPLAAWVQVGSDTFAGGPFTFTDLQATNYPARFYRVVTP